jgi:hypothetical protein
MYANVAKISFLQYVDKVNKICIQYKTNCGQQNNGNPKIAFCSSYNPCFRVQQQIHWCKSAISIECIHNK